MTNNNAHGYYFGRYEVAEEEYAGDDFSKRCFVFPGQGFAFPGMFKREYLELKTIRKTFDRADILAQRFGVQSISDYIVAPERVSEERLPIVRNLALFTLEVALCELLVLQKKTPAMLTGHSYGEYAVLVSAGVLSFDDAFDVAYHRDHFAPRPNEAGVMIAVVANEDEARTALQGMEFHVSNINSPVQTVLSVRRERVAAAQELLAASGLRHKVLEDVPQPYHSPYLDGVRDAMRQYIAGTHIEIRKPHTPFVSSVTHTVIDRDNFNEDDIRRIMTEQITEPVRFIGQIESAYDRQCRSFVDILNTHTFGKFVKDILAGKEIKTYAAGDMIRPREKVPARGIAPSDSKLFALVSRIIGEITGYEIEKIALEDRYQEDLGIDSIKKADILLTVLNESNIDPGEDFSTARFGSVGDTVAYLEQTGKRGTVRRHAVRKRTPHFGRYVFVWKKKPLDERLLIEQSNGACMAVSVDEIHADTGAHAAAVAEYVNKGGNPTVVLRAGYHEVEYEKVMAFYAFWNTVAKHIGQHAFTVVLASSGVACPAVDGYASFLKSMKKELPEMFFKYVRIADTMNETHIDGIVQREAREPFDVDVLYEMGVRLVSVREPAGSSNGDPKLNEQSVVVAIGGAKGITFSLLKHIAQRYRPVIYVIGRSMQEDATVAANMAVLQGDSPKVRYVSLDARSREALDGFFANVHKEHGVVDLVINGAGVVDVALLKDKKREQAEDELSAKLFPAMHLLQLREAYRLKRIINFSSVISAYGSAGQGVYTMANEMIAGLSAPYDDVCVVHWPAWEDTGMTARGGISKNLERMGVSLLKPEAADVLFAHELAADGPASVYYMDEDDDVQFGFGLNHFSAWRPLIGTVSNAAGMSVQNALFDRTFDQKNNDGYLKDHRIGGVGYVPASVIVSMFLCVGRMHEHAFPTVERVVVQNPVVVKDMPVACRLQSEQRENGYGLSLRSNIVHASCRLRKRGSDAQSTHAIPEVARTMAPAAMLYGDWSSEDALYLGPTFQCVESVLLDKDGRIFIRIKGDTLKPIVQSGPYDRIAQRIESAFQTLGAVAAMDGAVCIPVTVGEISIHFETENSRYLYGIPTVVDNGPTGVVGDIVVVNERGEVMLAIKHCVMKKIADRPAK